MFNEVIGRKVTKGVLQNGKRDREREHREDGLRAKVCR